MSRTQSGTPNPNHGRGQATVQDGGWRALDFGNHGQGQEAERGKPEGHHA